MSKRFLAKLIDNILYSIAIYLVVVVLNSIGELLFFSGADGRSIEDGMGLSSFIVCLALDAVYTIGFEASSKRGTFGKQLMGIEVVNYRYRKITVAQATVRYIFRYLDNILMIGNLIAVFSKKKQTLHDRISLTYVALKSDTKPEKHARAKQPATTYGVFHDHHDFP
ncbi:RDD family protein [Paenibacillus sp. SAF-054]|uniref:RDD family protein n=1 Tax=unclassified Paenibacillus TaxID=185978 RepID=UPI003F7E997F